VRPPAGGGSPLLNHPRRVLVVAFVFLAGLGVLGLGVEDKLAPTTLNVPGTEAGRANQMLREHFGDSAPFAILLRGPANELDRQGPELIRALRKNPAVTTLSPWDRGSVQRLRPTPNRALIIADFHTGITEAVRHSVPELEEILAAHVHAPVRATQTGFATLSKALQEESIEASERGELIAFPILLIVLLLVFRSPIAAAIPLGFGAITVIASRGILYLATGWFDVDAFALAVCTMMGLALGVDYALLMVSRFREELAGGATPLEAARETRHTAGRTTAFAGSTLLISMIVSIFILPGSLLASMAATVAMVVVLSVLVATVVGPSLLILIGPNVDRWRIGPAPNGERSGLMAFVTAALRKPVPVAAAIFAVLLVLALPALGLKTGPPSTQQLSPNDPARKDAELVDRTIGPGWDAPFVIVATAPTGSVTEPDRLAALSRWQRRIAAMPGVQAVIGPGQVAKAVAPVQNVGRQLASANGESGPLRQLGRLGKSLALATTGVHQLRGGLAEASAGAGLLAQGSDRAHEGANAIAGGLGRAAGGTEQLIAALKKFASGTERLVEGQRRAEFGVLSMKLDAQSMAVNLHTNALPPARAAQKSLNEDSETKLPQLQAPAQVTEEQLKQALQQLESMTVGKSDPNYPATLAAVRQAMAAFAGTDPATGQPYAAGYAGLPAELAALRERLVEDRKNVKSVTFWITSTTAELKKLFRIGKRVGEGEQQLVKANETLAKQSQRLLHGVEPVQGALGKLGRGATELAAGIARLAGGTQELEQKLAEGFHRSYPLQSGLRRATVRVVSGHASLNRRVETLNRRAPGIFNSGYFVLSAIDGAPPTAREQAGTAIDLRHGGQAAAMLVISRYTFNSPGSIALNKKLSRKAKALGEEAGLETGVAGGAAQLNDYSRVTRERIPYVIAAITLVTFLVLILVLRALPLAAIAVGLNLATVAVAFGVLTLLFNVPEGWPLGGHTYVDAVGATAIFGVVFGLSIDYAVFLLVRMRERYDQDGDNVAAIHFGLQKTARVITGAAAIMMAVFIAFAGSQIATVSQLGIGLTVAVLLDATVVRIVLLPALMLLLGERVWWLPRWLDRALPRLNV
jgi:putative drug exporter of the RND superfamily